MIKMTKKDAFAQILEVLIDEDRDELVEFVKNEIQILEKKAESAKNSPANKENLALCDAILEEMEIDREYTVTEMTKNFKCCDGLSSNKVNAMIKKLKDSEKIVRLDNGKQATFKREG